MKTIQVVYHATGENQGTYDPLCFAENFNGDISETTEKFISHDFNQYTTVNRYEVREVTMPHWMDEAEYLRCSINLKYAHALTGENILHYTRTQLHNLFRLDSNCQFVIGWLTKQKKNPFLKSLAEQCLIWLSEETPKYGSPLSPRQWETATRNAKMYEVKYITSRVYRER